MSAATDAKLVELLALPEGWDSYGGAPVKPEAATEVAEVVALFEDLGFPEPWIGPVPDGGLIIEWERGTASFSLEWTAPGSLYTFICRTRATAPLAWGGTIDGNESAPAALEEATPKDTQP